MPPGGGSVIRDERGGLLAVFCVSYGLGFSSYAELRTLIDGVRICSEMNYLAIQIECDSRTAVDWVCNCTCTFWRLRDE